jgi:nitrogen fixation/metabolism regulation signal transduction histidine kinase
VAASLNPSLRLVVAAPRTSLDRLVGEVRLVALLVGGGSLLAALVAALVLSGRIARPVVALAAGARRVAGGEDAPGVAVAGRDEIGELAIAFNAMNAELRSSRTRLLQAERVAAWREMARRLAHELKNPLFPIQLSVETLRRAHEQAASSPSAGATARLAALVRDSTDTILEELRALRKIIDEFSQFARMPRPRPEPVDLRAVVDQVLALYQARTAALDVRLEHAPELPLVPADRDLLGRALGNLVANAVEAMPEGGTLRVATSVLADAVALEVSDTGPGLTDEQRTRLFTPYFTTKKGGTGLGLAIVQGIVSDHGGRIEVASEAGRGTTFTLLLPSDGAGEAREKRPA